MLCIRGFFVFSFSAFQRIQTKKDSRLSQDSYLYINLISIMKNNSYSFMLACMIALLVREQ